MRVALTQHDQTVTTHHSIATVTQHAGQAVQLWGLAGDLIVSYDPTTIAYIQIGDE